MTLKNVEKSSGFWYYFGSGGGVEGHARSTSEPGENGLKDSPLTEKIGKQVSSPARLIPKETR